MKTDWHIRLCKCLAAAAVLCVPMSCGQDADGLPDNSGGRTGLVVAGITPLMDTRGGQVEGYTWPAEALNPKKGTGFDSGDKAGFFSDAGNRTDGNDGSQGFSNFPLTYNGGTFNAVDFDFDLGRLGYYFAYYPYKEGIEQKEGVSVYQDPQGDKKVIDFVSLQAGKRNEGLYSGNDFVHTFAVIRILRGKGFENFDGEISVQLKRLVKNVRIDWKGRDYEDSPFTSVKLVYDDEAVSAESRRLPTFKETKDSTYWDVIVPCLPVYWRYANNETAGGVTVEAIVLNPGRDDEQAIPVDNKKAFVGMLRNGTVTVGVRGSFIYTVEIRKNGFNASVYPYTVKEWGEEQIAETMPTGIGSVTDYLDFVTTCNQLFTKDSYATDELSQLLNNDGDEYVRKLKQYGTDVDGTFTVFLTADIDFADTRSTDKDCTAPRQSYGCINRLPIVFDGRGKTISNLHVQKGFCGALSGTLKNVRFSTLVIEQTDDADTTPIGLLATTAEQGSVMEDCVVEGTIMANSNTPVGAAVGTMKGGTVRRCRFTGTMVGGKIEEGHNGLVGVCETQTGDHMAALPQTVNDMSIITNQ